MIVLIVLSLTDPHVMTLLDGTPVVGGVCLPAVSQVRLSSAQYCLLRTLAFIGGWRRDAWTPTFFFVGFLHISCFLLLSLCYAGTYDGCAILFHFLTFFPCSFKYSALAKAVLGLFCILAPTQASRSSTWRHGGRRETGEENWRKLSFISDYVAQKKTVLNA